MEATKILALDWGRRRLGFAVSDQGRAIAFPLAIVECGGEADKRRAVQGKLAETGAGLLVVGLPLLLDGTEGEAAAEVRRFIGTIEPLIGGIEIVFWDERLTTEIARRALLDTGRQGGRSKKRLNLKERSDSLAASVLLQSYLDARANQAPA